MNFRLTNIEKGEGGKFSLFKLIGPIIMSLIVAEKRVAKNNLNEPSQKQIESAAGAVEPPRKSRRREKSADSSSRGSTAGILPKLCIICKKKELFYNDKVWSS